MTRTATNILASVVAIVLTAVTFQQVVVVPVDVAPVAATQLA